MHSMFLFELIGSFGALGGLRMGRFGWRGVFVGASLRALLSVSLGCLVCFGSC